MRKILIVGAGQSGLHLAHGLLTYGYDVTLITSQSSAEIRTGRPAITQITYPTVLGYERELGLDFWSVQAPKIDRAKVHAYPPGGTTPMAFSGGFDEYAISIDRRVKMADWLEYFEDRGGKVVIHGVTVSDLDYFSRMFDLVIIAVGGGELGALFDVDRTRGIGQCDRVLAQAHIYNVATEPGESDSIAWVGSSSDAYSIFFVPILTAEGPCHSLFLVDKPGGPMDQWRGRTKPEEQWALMKEALQTYMPQFYERCEDAELVDGRSRLIETVSPQVRKPVGVLPSGGRVLGIADVVITSDPFAGQGWNNSTRCAKSYLESILEHGNKPIDEEFLSGMFARFWEYGQHAEKWANIISSFGEEPPPPHFQEILQGALTYSEIADRWIQAWDYPPDYQEWLYDPELARKYLAEVKAAHES
ncbi:styrene monooxygenase/indole monooxygenase family protein [Allosalinactinospora lopnorensis]|uniref:styrene monooxygenase/indole monooxygenase family protein n=1 Tax=Allosalinactinospora lopnorensis TaxID=1352348 RepID=UPI000623DD74|nr:styrene monooxygenase/indole monooxygenase family protein [Allosalinactinospora lopnorensis]